MLYFESTIRTESPICHILRKQMLVLVDTVWHFSRLFKLSLILHSEQRKGI